MSFLRSAASQVIGLFVSDWLQSAVIVVILAAGWFAVSRLSGGRLVVLGILVLLLAGQLVWFARAEARRVEKA